nr:hypothetical protein [uncultured Devosia sp.]
MYSPVNIGAIIVRLAWREAAPSDFVDLYLRRLRDNDAQVLKAAA